MKFLSPTAHRLATDAQAAKKRGRIEKERKEKNWQEPLLDPETRTRFLFTGPVAKGGGNEARRKIDFPPPKMS